MDTNEENRDKGEEKGEEKKREITTQEQEDERIREKESKKGDYDICDNDNDEPNNIEKEREERGEIEVKKKARILWHDMYVNGPIVGVALLETPDGDEKVHYFRNQKGFYELRKFKEGKIEEVEENHIKHCEEFGYHREHDPAKFKPKKSFKPMEVRNILNYAEYVEKEIYVTLEEKDIDWLTPPTHWM
jgi:hypothetical protein